MPIRRWDDALIDTNQFLQLQDLTIILSQMPDLHFDYSNGSFINKQDYTLTGSALWNTTEQSISIAGYKTDVYLRAIGTIHHSQLAAFHAFLQEIKESRIQKFAKQLLTLLEDMRLEEIIKHARPGTITDFTVRKSYLKHYFQTQRTTNITRNYALDELFCMIYLQLIADGPDPHYPQANDQQLQALEKIKPYLNQSFEANSTKAIVNIATQIVWMLENYYEDTINTYFSFPIFDWDGAHKKNTLFDELTRTDDVENTDQEEVDNERNEYMDETFSTWHHENENADRKQTFLQMDLDVGTKTNLKGGEARETESGDQAFASAQGTSGKSNQQDYSKLEALEEKASKKVGKQNHAPYGEDNIDAVAISKEAKQPSQEDLYMYETFVTEIQPYKRKLTNTIEKVLEHKRIEPRENLYYGRLSKNLLPILTDENPRLFYKKDEESNEFDAVFTLLVDCSASMHTKMEDTKRGIVLFHEVLKHLKIPHSIIGFWEDAALLSQEKHSNYFHVIHSFTDSLYENNGAKIMQLEAEEDNRDGFSIRIIAEQMLEKSAAHKCLLVFSDGEPAAANYDQNGITDTHLAVSEARKRGIDVIGMFLSDHTIDEREEKMMENIYGREHVLVPDIALLPELIGPILKKLLLRTI